MPLMMDNPDFGDTAMNDVNLGGGDTVMNDVNLEGTGIMDSMDDLFGEAAADGLNVHVPLQPLPPPPQLVERFAEMQTSGACTKLAWSNTGSIAHISSDGSKVSFHVFCENRRTGVWGPTKASASPIYAPEGSRFVHVQFNTLGQDLAIIDDVGLTYFYIMPSGLGRTIATPSELNHDRTGRSELDGVVGMYYLPPVTEFKAPYLPPSSKINGVWMAQTKSQNQTKAHHPMTGRSALLQVSRNGCVSLVFQGDGSRWHSNTTPLDHIVSSRDLITHASFCAIDDRVLLATYDHAQTLRILSLSVEWNSNLQKTQSGQSVVVQVKPALKIGHVASVEHASAEHVDTGISSLVIVPPEPSYTDPGCPSFPTVLGMFVNASLPVPGQNQIAFTTIARWQLEDVVPTLHESFGKLKGNTNASPTSVTKILRRQRPDLASHKLVLYAQPLYHDTLIALVHSDGTIEYRERMAMNIVGGFGDTTFVANLPQSGFEHMATDHNIHASIIANGAFMAYVRPEGKVEAKAMVQAQGWQLLQYGINDTKGMLEAAVICLAREHVTLTYNTASTAELVALVPRNFEPSLASLFIREIFRGTTRHYDLALMDMNQKHQIAIKDSITPRCLGAQLGLGVHLHPELPKPPAQLAWAMLSMKHAVYCIMTTMREPGASPAAIASLHGIAKYCTDIIISVFSTLLVIRRTITTEGQPIAQAFTEHIAATNTPAVHLLLCSYSRVFLRFMTSYVPRLMQATHQSIDKARSLTDQTHLTTTALMFNNLPFKFDTLATLVEDTEKAVRDAYTPSPDRARDAELDMITSCALPEILCPVLDSLVTTILPKVMPDLDVAKIYFWDTTWLRLAPVEPQRYDAVRKIPLPVGAKLRHCRRCGSVMEDFGSEPERTREQPPWVQQTQRHCLCTCVWYIP